ncbi:MAG: TatD family hydrolase [Spirochaetaceae bacterium]|nr:TatD family hydrolase [Spirochaetaceae bacterium]
MDPPSSKILLEATKKLKYTQTTCAIHPMVSDKYSIAEIIPYLEKVNIIGEIGMDSVWTDVDLLIQEDIFIKQLEIAQKLKKPVIVHSKGQEKRISELLKLYTMEKIIHWYSSLDYLDSYIDLNCYFTVGPSILVNEKSVINLVKKVDISKLMVETDGIEAINWALGTNYTIEMTGLIISKMINKIARLKDISSELVEKNIEKNFFKFY